MKGKVKHYLLQIINAVILAGLMIFLIGLYYQVIKAGIPYQDPPLELQIQYAVNMGIGDVLVGKGLVIAICGAIARLVLRLVGAKNTQ